MSYHYDAERPALFTDSGQRTFLRIRDQTHRLLKTAGAVRLQEAITGTTGDSWLMLACIDRLVELGEIHELTGPGVAGQHRVFIKNESA